MKSDMNKHLAIALTIISVAHLQTLAQEHTQEFPINFGLTSTLPDSMLPTSKAAPTPTARKPKREPATRLEPQTENTRLVLCCREAEWKKEEASYAPYLCGRIEVIHKSSGELAPYYEAADVCSLLFRRDAYRELAKPFKAFEYLAHEKPVLSTKGTAIGIFVEKNDIGWNIACSAKAIQRVFKEIFEDPALLSRMRKNCRAAKAENLWTCRAEQVVKDLVK